MTTNKLTDKSGGTISIQFNGQAIEVPAGSTIADLLELAQVRSRLVAVEVNLELVERSSHGTYIVQPADAVEVVTLVGGG
jgi:sulfur carrier protein